MFAAIGPKHREGLTMLLISHNLGVIEGGRRSVGVMQTRW